MSYTTVELVRTHLATRSMPIGTVTDQSVTLHGSEYTTFADGPVNSASIVVKSNQADKPKRVSVTLTNGSAEVSVAPIVPGSLVAASDTSLGAIYTENRDFIIDYRGGTLHRKADGRLEDDSSLVVWFIPFTVYESGADYVIDANGSSLRRVGTGDIADGETVLIDYELIAANVTTDILDSAVSQANNLIAAQIDPSREFGADPVLEAAATYRALEIVAYSLTARELSGRRGDQQVARTWLILAEQFARRAAELLDSFRPPADRMSPPIHT